LKLCRTLRGTDEARIIARQVLRSGTSVAANYRALCRARSRAEFVARIGVVIEESDETLFWLELLVEGNLVSKDRLSALMKETNELLAIFGASQRTAKNSR
jgi:four helix bundle protein